jgi:hypothetical protein
LLAVLDDKGTDALAQHYLYTVGGERLTDALVTPDLVRISRNAFVPKDKAEEVYKKIQNTPLVKDVRPQLIAAINRGETDIRLTPQMVDDIVSRIGPDTLRGRGLTDQQKIWEENDEKAFCKKFRNNPPYQNARKEYESILRRLDVTRWNQNIWVIIAAIASLLSAIAAIVAIVPKDTSSASTSTKLEESTKSISSPTTPKNVK